MMVNSSITVKIRKQNQKQLWDYAKMMDAITLAVTAPHIVGSVIKLITIKRMKTYVLKKDCSNIGKEEGDYYNNEYSESIEELIEKGIIEEEISV